MWTRPVQPRGAEDVVPEVSGDIRAVEEARAAEGGEQEDAVY